MSHDVKLSLDMGKLVPVACMEVIPGDKWNINSETLLRFAPMVAPLMHKVNVTTHWFFVPNRIVWPGWERFITANNGNQEIPSPPYMQFIGDEVPTPSNIFEVKKGSLADYLGLPVGEIDTTKERISMIPFAGYSAIYDEYYRDQNLQPRIRDSYRFDEEYLVDGANQVTPGAYDDGNAEYGSLQRRSWQHDYFTASLPFAQKGDAVTLPIADAGVLPVKHSALPLFGQDKASWDVDYNGTPPNTGTATVEVEPNMEVPDGGLYVDASIDAATINDLRRAFKLQEWLEKMARGGSRYIEQILVHFGVKSSDARLQRPEFLGGSKQPVIVSEVLQTAQDSSSTEALTPLGTMAGHGISAGRGSNIRYTAEEHGYIFGIMSVTPLTAYQQGVHKHWTRRTHLDYAWPSFAHIGEQEVLNKELYFDSSDGLNDETFGYVPRYSEYKYMASRVAGDFRENLAFWHLGRIFESRPALNAEFIECKPRKDIFAVQDAGTQNLWSHVYHSIRVTRRLPKYGTPTL